MQGILRIDSIKAHSNFLDEITLSYPIPCWVSPAFAPLFLRVARLEVTAEQDRALKHDRWQRA
jgi:hypothetical protein